MPYLLLFLMWLSVAPSLVFAQRNVEISKKIEETFRVQPNHALKISNRFGDVKISTWDRPEIRVSVDIKAWGSTERDAQRTLERVDVKYGQNNGNVEFSTVIANTNIRINQNAGMQINYTVVMPSTNPLQIDNKFGALIVGDFTGEANLNASYGGLTTGRLLHPGNKVKVEYGQASIEEIAGGYVQSAYCKFTEIKKAREIKVQDRYGKLEVGEVEKLTVDLAYSKLQLGKVSNTLDLNIKYANADIDMTGPQFTRCTISNSYSNVNIRLAEVPNFSFQIKTSYGTFKHNISDLLIQTRIEKNTSGEYAGKRGDGSGAQINISSSYGNIRFL
jgi:hypothetical protein